MNKAVIISCIFASTLFFSACGNSNISQDKKTEVKTTTQKVKKLYFDKIDGKKIIFKGKDTKSDAYRRIILKQKNNNWVVVGEGY